MVRSEPLQVSLKDEFAASADLVSALGEVLADRTRLPDFPDPVGLLIRDGVAPLARHFGVSPRTLRRLCAKAGLRLGDLKQQLRREALVPLLATDLPISEIATRLGFASSQTLARFLKKAIGSTATQVRQRSSGRTPPSGDVNPPRTDLV